MKGRCAWQSTNPGTSIPASGEPTVGCHGRPPAGPTYVMSPSSHATPAGSSSAVAVAAAPRAGSGPEAVASAAATAAPRDPVMGASLVSRAPCTSIDSRRASRTGDRPAHDTRRDVGGADGLGAPGRLDARRRSGPGRVPATRGCRGPARGADPDRGASPRSTSRWRSRAGIRLAGWRSVTGAWWSASACGSWNPWMAERASRGRRTSGCACRSRGSRRRGATGRSCGS